jgi:hypothetical protein
MWRLASTDFREAQCSSLPAIDRLSHRIHAAAVEDIQMEEFACTTITRKWHGVCAGRESKSGCVLPGMHPEEVDWDASQPSVRGPRGWAHPGPATQMKNRSRRSSVTYSPFIGIQLVLRTYAMS